MLQMVNNRELQNRRMLQSLRPSLLPKKNSKEDKEYFCSLVRSILEIRSEVKEIENLGNDENLIYGALLVLLCFANSKSRFPIKTINGWDLFRTAYMVSLKSLVEEPGERQSMTKSWYLYIEKRRRSKNAEGLKTINERMDSDIDQSKLRHD